MKILVTGASGFIGRRVVSELLSQGYNVRVVRHKNYHVSTKTLGIEELVLSGLGYISADWKTAVNGCDLILHLAGLAHISCDAKRGAADAYYLANVEYARACCEAAVEVGARRFIFISSVGVHGWDSKGTPFRAESHLEPHTLYAKSKAVAERILANVISNSSMELTVIRPPLVYGPDAPGSFRALVQAISSGWPLPLGSVTRNRRSFVGIDNLVDLILTCMNNPAAANEAFLVSDGEDLSTFELLKRLSEALGKSARLFPVPVGCLALGAAVLGKGDMFQSLCGSLEVDIGRTCELLNWKPKVSVDEGLRLAVSKSCIWQDI